MTSTNLPAELIPHITTIEYVCQKQPSGLQPAFLFVLDTCVRQEEFDALKESVLKTIDLLPKNSLVGLITFGTTVQVYDLSFTFSTRSVIFRGTNNIELSSLQHMLDLKAPGKQFTGMPDNPYILPLSKCEENFRAIIEELCLDPRIVQNDKRPLRSTGVAVSISISLLELLYANRGARIMLFISGPCTQGPGLVVSEELKEQIRSHHELNKETAKHYSNATKFYSQQSKRAATNGHAIDVFSCSLDQIGLLEMRSLVKDTGGIIIFADGFYFDIFKNSLYKMFEKNEQGYLQFGLNAEIEVYTSMELKVMGAIGHMASLGKKSNNVSDNVLGIGKTSAWKIPALDRNSTFAFLFEVVNQHSNSIQTKRNGMVQFHTTYQHPNGYRVLRVTTVAHAWCDPSLGHKALLPGFDQETAAALMARIAVYKNETEDANSIRWLDRTLIQLYNKFCTFQKGIPETLQIPDEMNVYHQFMFYLRRGPLIQVFNNSPDETTFFRYCLLRENVSNVLVMIQPTLDSYTLDEDPQPALLSATSVLPTNVLLLDTFFHIIVHYGSTIAQWRKAGYHENPEYENLKELLEMPLLDAEELMKSRLPLPMYIECDQGTSQARFLVATIDPSITHNDFTSNEKGEVVFSEDVNLRVFVDFLKKRVVEFE